MIDLDWCPPGTALESVVEPELREMLDAAAVADAAAGFPQLSLDDPVAAGTVQVLVWLLPDERSGRTVPSAPSLAAYLRVEPDGEVFYVVRPQYRSRGITTLMLEKVGLDMDGGQGWQGTGLRSLKVWARGNHPAALRMSQRFGRFGIRVAAQQWQLLIPLRSGREIDPGGFGVRTPVEPGNQRTSPAPDPEPIRVGNAVAWVRRSPVESTEYGEAGRIVAVRTEGDPLRPALVGGLERLREAGLRAALITVDPTDEQLVHEARSLGLMHDQTDVLYTVGPA